MTKQQGVYIPTLPKDSQPLEQQVCNLRKELAAERLKHSQTKEQLGITMKNYLLTQMNMVDQLVKTQEVERKFNWWQKIINRYI